MTSEPDSTPRRRSGTIDLTATEVASTSPPASDQAEKGGEGTDSPPNAAAAEAAHDRAAAADPKAQGARRNGRGSLKGYALSAAIGAVAVGAIGAGLWIAGPLRWHEVAPPPAAKTSPGDDISARLDKIQQALQTPAQPQPDPALVSRLMAAEAQAKVITDQLAALNRRVDDVAAASQTALAQAKAAAAVAETVKTNAQSSVTRSDVEALGSRIAALERTIKTLADDAARHPSSAGDRVARLTVASEALRAAVERGAPYQAELATAKALGADPNTAAALEPFAAGGVPSAAALGHELAQLTPALLQTSGSPPNDDSFLRRLESHAQKLVRVTPVDAPAGDDPLSLIARINADAAQADIAAALADIARLPEAIRAVAKPWVERADARNAAVAASRRIAADALAALGKPATQ